jgi:hypothetical protein
MSEKISSLFVQKESTTFRCGRCKQNLELPVERVEDRIDQDPHPFEYFAHCPTCKNEITEAPFVKNLYRAWLNITGTKSPEVSARNLPAPDDPRRKFNALKSGLFAKKAKYFPAKVGRYPECDGCEHSHECETIGICLQISKVKMMVAQAFDSKDPAFLQPLFQDIQADVFVLLQRLIGQALRDGAILTSPVWHGTKDSYLMVNYHDPETGKLKQLMQHELHPAIRAIAELLQKNGLSLADLQMTPKTQADHAAQMGHLKGQTDERMTTREFQEKKLEQNRKFLEALSGATARREKDPMFREHQEEAGMIPVEVRENDE